MIGLLIDFQINEVIMFKLSQLDLNFLLL